MFIKEFSDNNEDWDYSVPISKNTNQTQSNNVDQNVDKEQDFKIEELSNSDDNKQVESINETKKESENDLEFSKEESLNNNDSLNHKQEENNKVILDDDLSSLSSDNVNDSTKNKISKIAPIFGKNQQIDTPNKELENNKNDLENKQEINQNNVVENLDDNNDKEPEEINKVVDADDLSSLATNDDDNDKEITKVAPDIGGIDTKNVVIKKQSDNSGVNQNNANSLGSNDPKDNLTKQAPQVGDQPTDNSSVHGEEARQPIINPDSNEVRADDAKPIAYENGENDDLYNTKKTSFNVGSLISNNAIIGLPVPSFVNNYDENKWKDETHDKYHLNYVQIAVDPINNFYGKITESVDPLVDQYLSSIINEDHSPFKKQEVLIKECDRLLKEVKDYYTKNNIRGKKIGNGFIIFLFFLIIGLFLLPIFLKNKKAIKAFEEFERERLAETNDIWNVNRSLSLQFASRVNYNELMKYVTKKLNMDFDNDCDEDIYTYLKRSYKELLDVSSAITLKYKNTPILDCIAKHKEWEYVTTSHQMSFPYTDISVSVNSDGSVSKRSITRYETLVAYHYEHTPYIRSTRHQILKTNFKPGFNFQTNLLDKKAGKKNKNRINFENEDFSKLMNITNQNNQINAELLEFFTIKAQEDYVKWYEDPNNWVNFRKLDRILVNTPQAITHSNLKDFETNTIESLKNITYTEADLDLAYRLNDLNVQYLIKDKYQTITELIKIIKIVVKDYLTNWAKRVTPFMLSPAISREWYSEDKNYKISTSDTFEKSIIPKKPNYEYILSKVFRNNLLYLNKSTPGTDYWYKIVKINKEGEFAKYSIIQNAYEKYDEIDYVTVYGVHVGKQIIPVPYVRYYHIYEPKFVYFLKKENNHNHIFTITNNKNKSYFNIAKNFKLDITNKSDFKINHAKRSVNILNPFLILNNQANERYLQLLDEIRENCSDYVHVQANDDGYFIFVNTTTLDDINNQIIASSVAKLKNNLLELNQLQN
ncbi:hypothetical protein LNO75_02270 [Mycoplasma sp. T363T]|uniref:hypothetical protein n=1 Tax=Mycoplasma bradburyae TaxID=2963128 RepID=UPI002341AA5D|nr:hypothetical protein [Mycoplasma bradburyae]MDC4163401.1 hypothetical protein [Mycoplasma bradburyae]